jgi:hypothetical protein
LAELIFHLQSQAVSLEFKDAYDFVGPGSVAEMEQRVATTKRSSKFIFAAFQSQKWYDVTMKEKILFSP